MSFSSRIKLLRGEISQAEFASRIKINVNTLRNYERGDSLPSLKVGANICKALNISPAWLLLGEGGMERDAPLLPAEDVVAIPKVKARLSAGTGSLETSGDTEKFCHFRSDWINRKCRPGQCVVMDVTGDSMEPTIRDKDIVLLDQGQTDIISGSVYAIGIDDEVLIKHVDKVPGHYVLRSANKEYAPINVDLTDESLNVRIIGRVLWMGREL